MLDLQEIKAAIDELERAESSFSAYAKLAHLYTILEHAEGEEKPVQYEMQHSAAVEDPKVYGDSDFLVAVSHTTQDRAWGIMDELMDTIKTVQPRVYASVMRKLAE